MEDLLEKLWRKHRYRLRTRRIDENAEINIPRDPRARTGSEVGGRGGGGGVRRKRRSQEEEEQEEEEDSGG